MICLFKIKVLFFLDIINAWCCPEYGAHNTSVTILRSHPVSELQVQLNSRTVPMKIVIKNFPYYLSVIGRKTSDQSLIL